MAGLMFEVTNCLIVTPTHGAYLDNGTDMGLTVDDLILAYALGLVKLVIADMVINGSGFIYIKIHGSTP